MALAIERTLCLNRPARSAALRLTWYLVVQSVVMLAWIFFRSAGIGGALTFISNIGDLKFGGLNRDIVLASTFLLPPAAMHLYGFLVEKSVVQPLGRLGQAALVGAMLFAVMIMHGESSEFLYFQF
jgi:hypothetical protein